MRDKKYISRIIIEIDKLCQECLIDKSVLSNVFIYSDFYHVRKLLFNEYIHTLFGTEYINVFYDESIDDNILYHIKQYESIDHYCPHNETKMYKCIKHHMFEFYIVKNFHSNKEFNRYKLEQPEKYRTVFKEYF